MVVYLKATCLLDGFGPHELLTSYIHNYTCMHICMCGAR